MPTGIIPASPKAVAELGVPTTNRGPRGEPIIEVEGTEQQRQIIAAKRQMSVDAAENAAEDAVTDDEQ